MYNQLIEAQAERIYMERLVQLSRAISFHIEAIELETDTEIIKMHIEALQYIEDTHFNNGFNIKDKIKEGKGEFQFIQLKCIDLGVLL